MGGVSISFFCIFCSFIMEWSLSIRFLRSSMVLLIGVLVSYVLFSPDSSSAYTLWIFSQSKTVQEILDVEATIVPYRFRTVAFILDDYFTQWALVVKNIVDKLGTGRVYHLTLSPDMLTAKQVADGAFDEEYKAFFKDIKRFDLKVLFRTMHEMNGWRYAWSSDPEQFVKAWKRVRDLSREAWLDTTNIQFIFSFNIHDMPVLRWYEPGQQSKLLTCTPARKKRMWCFAWEDYYPGSGYVDILWFTVYNWGKWNSNRKWMSFSQIVNDPLWNQWSRATSMDKPIYIDEVWSTAVQYDEPYTRKKSQYVYQTTTKFKSQWLYDLADTIDHTPEIIGINYFNVDYTNGLRNWIVWEADWRMIDPDEWMLYRGWYDLLRRSDNLDMELVFGR